MEYTLEKLRVGYLQETELLCCFGEYLKAAKKGFEG